MAGENNPFFVAPVNPLQALMGFQESYASSQQDAARGRAKEALAQGNYRNALAELIGSGSVKEANALAQYQQHANSVFGTPIYGTVDGKPAIGTFDKGGSFRPIDTGNFQVTPGVKTIDTGTGTLLIDSRTGAPVSGGTFQPPQLGQPIRPSAAGYVPKDVAGEAREKQYGKEVGDRQADLGRARSSLESNVSALDRLATQANEVLQHPGLGNITGWMGVLPNVPGGPGADAQAKLNTLKSQIGFSVLQAMREASKTGGALGAVSDAENKLLQNNIAELENAQSLPQFKAALKKIIDYTEGAKERMRAAYQQDYANIPRANPMAQPTTHTGPVEMSKTIDGVTYDKINGKWYQR